jgi:type IV pilus assembly protein PilB
VKLLRRDAVPPSVPGSRRPLGELLVERGAASASTVQAALRRQRRDPRHLGDHLLDLGVPEAEILAALGEQTGRTPVDLDHASVEEDALLAVDAVFARERGVVPLRLDEKGRLHAATPTPDDTTLAAALSAHAERPVVLELAGPAAVQRALDRHYTVTERVQEAVRRAVDADRGPRTAAEVLPLRADAPVVQIVDLLLTQGLRDRASDIHIEPQADHLRIRFRVDGALHDFQSLPRSLAAPISSRLKILANMDIVDRHRSQDGQIAVELDGRAIDIRVATVETIWGEKVVLRLLDRSRSLVPLSDLGLARAEQERLRRIIGSPYGLLIVSGPTGAGKTTTLYSALNELDRSTRNITTIEDPVEYQFAGINQIQINRLAGMTFANGLRAILRQDPDVILVGEVRDVETAEIAIQSALTGHLVLCSLHAADSIGALHRFLDMGIEPFLVASAVVGVVAQRLVRQVCARCSDGYEPRGEEVAFYQSVRGAAPSGTLQAGRGCTRCARTGFYDRTGVFECLQLDDRLRELVVHRATHAELRDAAVAGGMRTLQEAGCDVIDAGGTTIAEVMRTVYII